MSCMLVCCLGLLAMLGEQLVDVLDIGLHVGLPGHPLLAGPRVPLGLPLQVEYPRPRRVAVSDRTLLVEPVHLLELVVAQGLVDLLGEAVRGLLEGGRHAHSGSRTSLVEVNQAIKAW